MVLSVIFLLFHDQLLDALVQLGNYYFHIVNIVSASLVLAFVESLQVSLNIFLAQLLHHICLVSDTFLTQLLFNGTDYCRKVLNIECLGILLVFLFLGFLVDFLDHFLHLDPKLFDLIIDLLELPRISCQNSLHHFAIFD